MTVNFVLGSQEILTVPQMSKELSWQLGGEWVKKTFLGITGGVFPFAGAYRKGERVTRSVVCTSSVAGFRAALLNSHFERPGERCSLSS